MSSVESEGGEDIRVEMEGSPLHRNHRRKWTREEVERVQGERVLREVPRPLLRRPGVGVPDADGNILHPSGAMLAFVCIYD